MKQEKKVRIYFRPEAKRISKHRRVGLTLGHLMWEHFGENTQLVWHDGVSGTTYRKGMIKLLEGTKAAVQANLMTRTDSRHITEVLEIIDLGITMVRTARTDDELNEAVLATYVRLTSLLLGQRTEHWRNEKVTLHKNQWKLDNYRSVLFYQNNEQKERLVYHLMANDHERSGLPDLREAWDQHAKYIKKHGRTDFMDWFRAQHPIQYMALFDR